jgi:hypothetical protein
MKAPTKMTAPADMTAPAVLRVSRKNTNAYREK